MTVVFAESSRDVVTVQGTDAASYLQGQLSQDVAAMAPGEVAWSFVLSPQGKVDGWGRVLRVDDETFQIDVDHGAGETWQARLSRFLLRTKADITVTHDVPALLVRGATVAGGLDAGWPGVEGADLLGVGLVLGDEEPDAELPADLPADARAASEGEWEALRISSGVPRWGAEIDADTIPATLGQWVIDASVSFTKGCYTGQELVARIDSRGGNVPRRLAGVIVEGPAPAPGTTIQVDGADAGTVTSSADSADGHTSVALVFAPRAIEVPTDAQVDGAPARLVELPFP
jgi:folate-binding protein YgfZ